ncbi:hypothetical protein Tsubulata_011702 [Turnera subulata]|uniref:Uncharacterized protein n=1 Tax=Turnera subulata TaxID=218843 RepID=A0A9Q0G9N2_9ROSI|nr:hypothetical protein Tsubulata_011702 [Turnera subulata]
MQIYLIADTAAAAAESGLGFANLLLQRQTLTLSPDPSSGIPQISAAPAIFDAVAPPPVKSRPSRTARRNKRRSRQKRRIRRGVDYSGDSGADYGFFVGGGGGIGDGDGDGPFGGGGGGSGGSWGRGSGWNFGGFGGQNSEEPPSKSDFDWFVYEVIYWIALSSCVHFAFKKFARMLMDGVAVDDDNREKVPGRLSSIC